MPSLPSVGLVAAVLTLSTAASTLPASAVDAPPGRSDRGPVSVREMECPRGLCEAPAPPSARTSREGAAVRGWTPETFRPAMVEAVTAAAAHPLLGSNLAATITEGDGPPLWSGASPSAMMPASSMKLLTALAALTTLSADRAFATGVWLEKTRDTSADRDAATVTIRGEGDPTLTKARVETLVAAAVADAHLDEGTPVRVLVDDTAFPEPVPAPGWKPDYITDGDIQLIRPLTYRGYRGDDGPMQVGRDVAAALQTAKLSVTAVKRGVASAGARRVAVTTSAPLPALVARMLQVSDNLTAEVLLRHIATVSQQPLTWEGTTGAVRAALAARGVPLQGYVGADGSGLSRHNRVPVATLAAVVRTLWTDPALKGVAFALDGVPRSGETGTLAHRFKAPSTQCAKGLVWAKTGMLNDVAALAGVAHGVDGTARVFVLLENGNAPGDWPKVRDQIDEVATAMVGCNLAPPTRAAGALPSAS